MISPSLDRLQAVLRKLPGLGYRSAERLALHLLVEKPERAEELVAAVEAARGALKRCPVTGNVTEGEMCPIYEDPKRDRSAVCVVETIPDLLALEKSASFRGTYHVLHGKLSPLHGVGPEQLNLAALQRRLQTGEVEELILALGADIESEATCHFIQEELTRGLAKPVRVSRIGFGLPSGSALTYADAVTLTRALEGRRPM